MTKIIAFDTSKISQEEPCDICKKPLTDKKHSFNGNSYTVCSYCWDDGKKVEKEGALALINENHEQDKERLTKEFKDATELVERAKAALDEKYAFIKKHYENENIKIDSNYNALRVNYERAKAKSTKKGL